MRIGFLDELGGDGDSVFIRYSLRDRHDTPSVPIIDPLDVFTEFFHGERTLRNVNQVRTVIGINPSQGRGRGEEAGMPPHNYVNLHALERAVIEIIAHHGAGHEFGGAAKTGGMVILQQIIIDCLGNMEAVQVVFFIFGFLVNDVHGLGRIVSADIKKIADIVFLQDGKDLTAFLVGRFFADRAEGRGWGKRHRFQGGLALLAQVNHFFLQHAHDAVQGAVDFFYLLVFPGLNYDANQALIDDHRGTTALGNQHVSF